MARSGTTTLTTSCEAAWGEGIRAEHEPLRHAARLRHLFRCFDAERQDEALEDAAVGGFVRDVVRSAESKPVLMFGNTLSHLAPVFHRVLGDRLRLLHLHRNPVVNAASIYVKTNPAFWQRTSYEDDPYGLRIAPFDPHARFAEYRERWATLPLFDRILYQWLERNAFAREAAVRMPGVPFLSLRSEDLFADVEGTIQTLARFVGLDPPGPSSRARSRRNQTWSRSLERRPLGGEWRAYTSHPAVLQMAGELGHSLDADEIEREMARYQLPPGIAAWLRHRTGYWKLRARTAHWLRERRFVPPAAEGTRGLPPRSLTEALREVFTRQRA